MEAGCPLVSVIVAVYGGDDPRFLREALESVLGQTWRDLEVLAVLDGPVPPRIEALIQELAAADPRLRPLALVENRGPAAARNAGIAAAQGAYIAILDADDVAAPHRIERQVPYLRETGAALAGSWYDIIDGEGRVLGRKQVPVHPEAVRRWMPVINPIAHSTVLAQAEVLKANPFREDYRFGEDHLLWATLVRTGHVLCNQPECLVRYRVDARFLARRQGWSIFREDLGARLATVPLFRPVLRPFVGAACLAVSSVRLLPSRLLEGLYRLRSRWAFRP